MNLIRNMSLKNILLWLLPHCLGANELIHCTCKWKGSILTKGVSPLDRVQFNEKNLFTSLHTNWLTISCHANWIYRDYHMMTSSNGKFSALLALCEENSPVTGEFPSQRPVTRSFGIFFDLRLNKRLSKPSRHRWSETPSRSLWPHCNAIYMVTFSFCLCTDLR